MKNKKRNITRPRVSDDEKYDIIYFHKNGGSVESIAKAMDIKVNRVKYVINRYHVEKPWYCKLLNLIGIKYA